MNSCKSLFSMSTSIHLKENDPTIETEEPVPILPRRLVDILSDESYTTMSVSETIANYIYLVRVNANDGIAREYWEHQIHRMIFDSLRSGNFMFTRNLIHLFSARPTDVDDIAPISELGAETENLMLAQFDHDFHNDLVIEERPVTDEEDEDEDDDGMESKIYKDGDQYLKDLLSMSSLDNVLILDEVDDDDGESILDQLDGIVDGKEFDDVIHTLGDALDGMELNKADIDSCINISLK
jgi:hypothetical protein